MQYLLCFLNSLVLLWGPMNTHAICSSLWIWCWLPCQAHADVVLTLCWLTLTWCWLWCCHSWRTPHSVRKSNMAAWFVWAVNGLPVLATWQFWDATSKQSGPEHKTVDKSIKKVLNFTLFPILWDLNMGCEAFSHQAAKWKLVFNQAAYHMDWRGPP